MRVNRMMVGAVLAATVVLTGCSGDSAGKPTESPKCPQLTGGATVDGAALGECITEATSSVAGYATTTTVLGQKTTGKFDPADRSLEATGPMGSLIVVGDDAWVKPASGDWQVADPSSENQTIASLSLGAPAIAQSSPTALGSLLTGDLSVTGTGERLGEEVFLVAMSNKDANGESKLVLEVTKDYIPLAATTTTKFGDTTVETVTVVTDWDVDQEIAAPL